MLQKGCHRRIGDKTPVEVTSVAQELQFITVETVAAVRCKMKDCDRYSDAKQETAVRARQFAITFRYV
jgi:hypothetical protein